MENEKTLKEKLWDKGKYFIPLYGGWKAAQAEKALTSYANMMSTACVTAVGIYKLLLHHLKPEQLDKALFLTGLVIIPAYAYAIAKSFALSKESDENDEKHFSKTKGLENEVEKN